MTRYGIHTTDSSLVLVNAALILVLTGCGSDAQQAPESGPGQAAPAARAALVISPRTYTSGSAKARVTGFFHVDATQQLNKPASITDEDQTWIQYGVSGGPGLDVLFTNSTSLAENGVTVGLGPFSVTATSTSGECQPRITVTATSVSGQYSCKGSTGYNKETGEMGKVDVEVDFDAGS
jgi:hypothetical protein